MIRAYFSSSEVSFAATPRSIARPMTAGITACVLIQMMPKIIPTTRVCHWPLAIHHRNAPGRPVDRRTGVVEGEFAHSSHATEQDPGDAPGFRTRPGGQSSSSTTSERQRDQQCDEHQTPPLPRR